MNNSNNFLPSSLSSSTYSMACVWQVNVGNCWLVAILIFHTTTNNNTASMYATDKLCTFYIYQ